MQEQRTHIRDSIIPNSSMRLMELCLCPDDDNIFMPTTQRRKCSIEYGADWALKDLISQRVNNTKKALPLALRKRKIYEEAFEKSFQVQKNESLKELFLLGIVPIIMRKHLLYQDCRAG